MKTKASFNDSEFIAKLVNGSRRQFLVNQLFGEIEKTPDSLNSWMKSVQAAKAAHAQK